MHSSKDGLVVLNIGYEAVRNYEAFDDRFEFNCLFRGVEFRMSINYFDVIGIRGPLGLIHPINVITVVDGAGNYLLAPIFPANGEIHPMTVAQETPPPSADDGVDNIKPFTASSDEKPKGSHLRVVK